MIKYASNALLATAISFANEIADLGSAIGEIDVAEVMAGVHPSRYLTTPLPDGTRSPRRSLHSTRPAAATAVAVSPRTLPR